MFETNTQILKSKFILIMFQMLYFRQVILTEKETYPTLIEITQIKNDPKLK